MKSQPKTVRLNNDLIKKITTRGKKENRNFSNMVETILMEADEKGII